MFILFKLFDFCNLLFLFVLLDAEDAEVDEEEDTIDAPVSRPPFAPSSLAAISNTFAHVNAARRRISASSC